LARGNIRKKEVHDSSRRGGKKTRKLPERGANKKAQFPGEKKELWATLVTRAENMAIRENRGQKKSSREGGERSRLNQEGGVDSCSREESGEKRRLRTTKNGPENEKRG